MLITKLQVWHCHGCSRQFYIEEGMDSVIGCPWNGYANHPPNTSSYLEGTFIGEMDWEQNIKKKP